jgi:hypothetical protein
MSARADRIITINQLNMFVCEEHYESGFVNLTFCTTEVPEVTCQCEHSGNPFSDLCEAIPQGTLFSFAFTPVGVATVSPPNPDSPFGSYTCPRSTLPHAQFCTASATVTNRLSGQSGTALCYSN